MSACNYNVTKCSSEGPSQVSANVLLDDSDLSEMWQTDGSAQTASITVQLDHPTIISSIEIGW